MCTNASKEEEHTYSDIIESIIRFKEIKETFEFKNDINTFNVIPFKTIDARTYIIQDDNLQEIKPIIKEINYLSSVMEIGSIIFKDSRNITEE